MFGEKWFCIWPKSLPEAKVKSLELIPLEEDILKQSSIDAVMWLLVLTLMKIYSEKKQAEQGNIKCTIWGEKEHQEVEWS